MECIFAFYGACLLAADVFSFLTGLELMAVVSFLLVNHEAEEKLHIMQRINIWL